jgi:DNA-directed RNA polymerase beta subunit
VFTPIDLINAKTLSSVINSLGKQNQLVPNYGSNQPLAEITHKRRLSVGMGGLSEKECWIYSVTFTIRTVVTCPIETPEGPNIGFISLVFYAKREWNGFIETPYRK